MGCAKDVLLEQEAKDEVAIELAIAAGQLKRCPYHEYVLSTGEDNYTAAYKHASACRARGDAGTGIFSSQREMTDAVKEAIQSHGDECPGCASWAKD